ncbi:unnamed protein product [Urochloa decumbens]|uniref:Uncharacterized protein n=1 Tax=Urochloa decumbens TaxID=240449 RepID=A0ABC9GAC9_9POAL
MALRPPSSAPRWDLAPPDSLPADSPPPTSQGESSNGAKAGASWKKKKEVGHLLVKLEKEGVEIDGKIASIIDDGIARIKAEAAREEEMNINEPKRNGMTILLIASAAIGFIMGAEWYEHAFRAANDKRRRALEEKLAKSRRA